MKHFCNSTRCCLLPSVNILLKLRNFVSIISVTNKAYMIKASFNNLDSYQHVYLVEDKVLKSFSFLNLYKTSFVHSCLSPCPLAFLSFFQNLGLESTSSNSRLIIQISSCKPSLIVLWRKENLYLK